MVLKGAKKMKKIFLIAILLLTCTGLCACNNELETLPKPEVTI